MFDRDSKVARHVHENDHEMDFGSVRVVGHEANYQERLFLEAWYSIKDPQCGGLQISRYVFKKLHADFHQRPLDVLLFESRVLPLYCN